MHVPFFIALVFFTLQIRYEISGGEDKGSKESPDAGTDPHGQPVKESIRLTTGF
jgi:hypothetical protein